MLVWEHRVGCLWSEVCVPGRTERATAVLLADPCFQLRSIQYLLGHAEPSALAAAAPPTDKRHFSLHTCKCRPCTGGWALLTTHSHSWGGRNGVDGVCVPCSIPALLVLGTGVYALLHHITLDGDVSSASQ